MIRYPKAFDGEDNLHKVHDCLRVKLSRDYNPGDKSVYVNGDVSKFPDQGIISLVDQCTEEKAIHLIYSSKSSGQFNIIGPTGNKDSFKPKDHTLVVQQVMAQHHNSIKDAIVAIQKIIGTMKDGINANTIYARVSKLKEKVFQPKAWFSASLLKGVAPLNVKFRSESLNIIGEAKYIWDFGDETTDDFSGPEVIKTFQNPGKYKISLTVLTPFGEDSVEFDEMIIVGAEAPKEANIEVIPQNGQIIKPNGVVKTPINQFVMLEVKNEKEPNTNYTYAGEFVDPITGAKVDPIINYTWELSDDLPHENSNIVKGIYSAGGLEDITLRVDTKYGAYRITNKKNIIDIVEHTNLFLWVENEQKYTVYEFGLFNETFKARNTTDKINSNSSFLQCPKAKKEFTRNNGFTRKGNLNSGSAGNCLIYWASGRSLKQSKFEENINFLEYNPFNEVYSSVPPIGRPWNWASLSSPSKIYFILGDILEEQVPALSLTNKLKVTFDKETYSNSNQLMEKYDYSNGSHDLMHNAVNFNVSGEVEEHFTKYRTAWSEGIGYLLRNDKDGNLKEFYCTEGNLGNPFTSINKLMSLPEGKEEGEIVPLGNSIYFFNNSGKVMHYNKYAGKWQVAGPISEFKACQDFKSNGYDKDNSTLVAASDGGRRAYLSFDYSRNVFIKFNEMDMTFTSIGVRPIGKQWLMGIF